MSKDGAVVRALPPSHQCFPGLIPGPGVICGFSLLLVLFLALRNFLRVLRFSPLLKKTHFEISFLESGTWNCQALYHEPLARVIAQALPVFDIKFALTLFNFSYDNYL